MSQVLINASTSLVQAVPPDVVFLSTLNYPGQIITVRDYSGLCSTGSVITISTTEGVHFLNGLSNSNIYAISQPYGFLTFTSKSSTIWAVVNSFAFQDQSVASIQNLNSRIILNSTIYSDVVSTTYLFPSSIGINCNSPQYLLDANGIINVKELYQDGRLFVPDGNLSTVNSSTINIANHLNISNSTPLTPPTLRIQDTLIYANQKPAIVEGSNQIYLYSNLINIDDTVYITSNHNLGVNLSTTTQSVDVIGNVQADSFLLRSSIVTMPAAISSPSISSVQMVASGNGLWFFSEDTDDAFSKTYVSVTNAFSWSTTSTYSGFSRNSMVFANGLWVAGGTRNDSATNAIVRSPDGFSWLTADPNIFTVVNSVLYYPTYALWIAVGISQGLGQAFATSPDAITWTFHGPSGRIYNDVTPFPTSDGLVVVGQNKVLDFYRLVGGTWSVTQNSSFIPGTLDIKSVQFANNLWVIGGQSDGSSNNTLLTNSVINASGWTSRSNPLRVVNKIRFFSSIFLAVGDSALSPQSNGAILTSLTGTSWTARSNPLLGVGRDVAYANGQWIVGGDINTQNFSTGGLVASLDNGSTWSPNVIGSFFSSSRITVSSSFLFLNGINITEPYTSNTTFLSTINSLQSGTTSTVAGLGSIGYLSTVLSTFSNLFTSTLNVAPGIASSTIQIGGNVSVSNINPNVPDLQLSNLNIRQSFLTNPTQNYILASTNQLNINNTLVVTNGPSSRVGIGKQPTAPYVLDISGSVLARDIYPAYIGVNTTNSNPAYVINANGTINATSYLQNGITPIFPNPLSSVVMSTLLVNSTNGFAITNNASTLLGGLLSSVAGANFGATLNAPEYQRAGVPIPRAYSTFQFSSLTLNTPIAQALLVNGSTILNGLLSTNGAIQTSGTINAGAYLLNGNPFAPDNVSSIAVSSVRSIVSPITPINITSYLNVTNPNTSNVWFAGTSNVAGTIGLYSLDNGVTWTASGFTGIGTNTLLTAAAWNGRFFLAAASPPTLTTNSVTFFSSINGISWTSIPATGTFPRTRINKIIWSGTQWIVGGSFTESSTSASNATIARSTDGGSWTGCTSGGFSTGPTTAGQCQDIALNGTVLVAAGNHESPTAHGLKYSLDNGANWISLPGILGSNGISATTNGRLFVAGGSNSPTVYSFNGINWSNVIGIPSGPNITTLSLATNGRVFVAHVNDGGFAGTYTFYYSFDGISWISSTTTPNTGRTAMSITWNGTRFIAGSSNSFVIHTSPDGITWTTAAPNTGATGLVNVPSIVFTSNVSPDLQIESLSFFGKNQWPTTRSTNTIHMGQSTLVIDNLVRIGTDGRVGINCNVPQYTLDVNGSFFASTITAGSITGFVTETNLRSSITGLGSSGYVSSATLLSTVTGLGSIGYISSSALEVSLQSTVVGLATSGYISSTSLNSSIIGLGSIGYVSTASLTSTVANLTNNFNSANILTSSIASLTTPTNPIAVNGFLDVINEKSSNVWVAVGQTGGSLVGNVIYSTDGSNWVPTNVKDSDAQSVAWNGNTFLTVTNNTGGGNLRYLTSSDGITWAQTTISGQRPDSFVNSILWTGTQWIVGGTVALTANSNSTITRSVDGVTWTGATSGGFTTGCIDLATNGRRIVAVGISATASENIKYSDDGGLTWLNATGGTFSSAGRGVATNGRAWVAVGSHSDTNGNIKYSSDGITWSNVSTPNAFTAAGNGVSFNGQLWVATGSNTGGGANIMIWSLDGRIWNLGSSGATQGNRLAWSGRRWVAATTSATAGLRLRFSDDSINWNSASGSALAVAKGVAFSSNVFPDLQVENLAFFGKSQYPTHLSTNSIYIGQSTLNINNTLQINNRTGLVNVNGSFESLTEANNITHRVQIGVIGTGSAPLNVPFTSIADGITSNGAAFDSSNYGLLQLSRPSNQLDTRFHLSFIRQANMVSGIGYLSNTNIWGFQSGGTSNSNGFFYDVVNNRFGINNSNPQRALHIIGDAVRFDRNTDTTSMLFCRTSVDYSAVWKTFLFGVNASASGTGNFVINDLGTNTSGSGTNRFIIDNNGNIGINTSTPEERLHVNGIIYQQNPNVNLSIRQHGSAAAIIEVFSTNTNSAGGTLRFGNRNNTTTSALLLNTALLRVGINNDNPAYNLHVNGTAYINNTVIVQNPTDNGALRFTTQTGDTYIQTGSNLTTGSGNRLLFTNIQSSGTSALSINTFNNRVGINCNAPTQSLDVNGVIRGRNNIVQTRRVTHNTSYTQAYGGTGNTADITGMSLTFTPVQSGTVALVIHYNVNFAINGGGNSDDYNIELFRGTTRLMLTYYGNNNGTFFSGRGTDNRSYPSGFQYIEDISGAQNYNLKVRFRNGDESIIIYNASMVIHELSQTVS